MWADERRVLPTPDHRGSPAGRFDFLCPAGQPGCRVRRPQAKEDQGRLDHNRQTRPLRHQRGGGAGLQDEEAARAGEINREENTAVRNDALNIASNIRTTVSVQRSGILGGVVFKDGRVINDGKNVQVLVRWDRKDNSQRRVVLKEMMQ